MRRWRFGPLSDAKLASDNGGKPASGVREHGTKKPAVGGNAPARRSVSVGAAQGARAQRSGALAPEQEHGGSRATGAQVVHSSLADEWAAKHRAALQEEENSARKQALATDKPWTIYADQKTQKILAKCDERKRSASPETLAVYRRDYDRLRARGTTPYEEAKSRSHWDRLRTACRVSMEIDIRAFRASAERARRRGDLAAAQRRTERAFRLAIVMNEMFIKEGRPWWEHKREEMARAGIKPVNKSKRRTVAPPPDLALVALVAGSRRGTKVLERNAERLALVSLVGLRPCELMKGVELRVECDANGRVLTATIKGGKVDIERGQELRVVRVPIEGSASQLLAERVDANGGYWRLESTPADCKSLNRALNRAGDLSCYTFRHQVGSECKKAVSQGSMTAEEAAQVMGHRSTVSLSAYGAISRSRGGRRLRAKAISEVRSRAVSRSEKVRARAERDAGRTIVLDHTPALGNQQKKPKASAADRQAVPNPLKRGPKPPKL